MTQKNKVQVLSDFQWGLCKAQDLSGFQWGSCKVQVTLCLTWLNLQFSVSWQVDFQYGSCGSIFSFLCHGRQIFSGVRVAQSLDFCVMVGRLLVGFVWLKLQFSLSWQVDIQWCSCGSIVSFLCNGRQTFSAVRVPQSLVFCVMVGRLLVGFVWIKHKVTSLCTFIMMHIKVYFDRRDLENVIHYLQLSILLQR